MSHAVWPRYAAPRAPVPATGLCWHLPPRGTLEYSKAGLAQSLWGLCVLVHTRFCLSPRVSLEDKGFDSKWDFAPPTILLGLLLCPWTWGIFFGGIQHSPVGGCSAVRCNFGVLPGEDVHTSFCPPSSSFSSVQVYLLLMVGTKMHCLE